MIRYQVTEVLRYSLRDHLVDDGVLVDRCIVPGSGSSHYVTPINRLLTQRRFVPTSHPMHHPRSHSFDHLTGLVVFCGGEAQVICKVELVSLSQP